LYWIVLREPGGLSIFDESYKPDPDKALPVEIELYDYFKTLRSPFHAYEADDPKSLASAISDIDQKERKPIHYYEQIPGRDFTQHCYFIAALMIGLLLTVKYLEVRTWH
jgi:mxaC protein